MDIQFTTKSQDAIGAAVVAMAAPSGELADVVLPNKALASLSPASTWKAEPLELNARCCLLLASVKMLAVTPALRNAVADAEAPFPAF